MGGSQTKQIQAPSYATPELSRATNATFSGEYLTSLAQQNAEAAQRAIDEANQAAIEASKRFSWSSVGYTLLGLLGLTLVVIVGIVIYDIYARIACKHTVMLPNAACYTENFTEFLDSSTPDDATTGVTVGTSSDTPPKSDLDSTPTPPASKPKDPPPPYLWSWFFGQGLLSGPQDGTQASTVSAASAPLSASDKGSYGMQWWMYVKDWNYGYGKEKEVVVRSDPSNPAIYNPRVVLHPTENALKIYVSVFPSDNSSGTSEPSPANSVGATDDVFICDVPNIPLQTWFSVSVSVFTRNLDVYIDGKLVKSCFLSGVPKPAAGDIQITPNGGFSGILCNFAHSSGMLQPADALNFYNKDTTCRSQTTLPLMGNATGYDVKFGVYDATGKTVKEFTF